MCNIEDNKNYIKQTLSQDVELFNDEKLLKQEIKFFLENNEVD